MSIGERCLSRGVAYRGMNIFWLVCSFMMRLAQLGQETAVLACCCCLFVWELRTLQGWIHRTDMVLISFVKIALSFMGIAEA